MDTLAIDLETYSDNDIKYGVYKYVDSPNFEILLLGYSFDDEPVQVIDLTKEEMPVRIAQALFDSSITKTAFNANFEITCFKKDISGAACRAVGVYKCTGAVQFTADKTCGCSCRAAPRRG